MKNESGLNFDTIVDIDRFDNDQIRELKEIYTNSNQKLFLFLSNHPEISSDCLLEIYRFSNGTKNSNDAIVGQIIQVLDIYMDHIKEKNTPCCFERIRYGLHAIESGLSYPYIQYLMCTPVINENNIKDVYKCFIYHITLARLTEVIPTYSIYTPDQVTQVCKSLIDVQCGQYVTDFIPVIKSHLNSAHDMFLIRQEAKKITKSLKVINDIGKSSNWMMVSCNNNL